MFWESKAGENLRALNRKLSGAGFGLAHMKVNV